MLNLLQPSDYYRVQPLLAQHGTPAFYCHGVLAGKYDGIVLVDDPKTPSAALVIKELWCTLLGEPTNAAFNQQLGVALRAKKYIGEQTNVLFFIDPSPAWLQVIATLLPDRQPIAMPRLLYMAGKQHFEEFSALSAEFELHFIDESLRTKVAGDLPSDVEKVLTLRDGVDSADEMAFGFVVLHQQQCAAWSVIDFIHQSKGEIRLVTNGAYRRRGLAATTSSAAIRYGLAHGLEEIGWDVAAQNLGSVRTAEKLGLQFKREPFEYMLIYPELGYLVNLAWSHLDAARFEAAQMVAQQMLRAENEVLIRYGHFLIGAASAGLGNATAAFTQLNLAIDAGWDDVAEMTNCQPLLKLQSSPEWQLLLNRINDTSKQ